MPTYLFKMLESILNTTLKGLKEDAFQLESLSICSFHFL